MSYQVGTACYPTAAAAAAATASGQAGAVVTHGSDSYVVSVGSVSGSAISYSLYPVTGGSALQVTAPYSAIACGLLDVSDGLAIGWLVAGCWLLTYGALFITRALRGDHGDT